MADEPAQHTGNGQSDTLVDEAIRAILSDGGGPADPAAHGKGQAAMLLETAALASTLTSPRTSMVERLLLAEAIGSAMAEALAPALAEQLIPRLISYLDDAVASQPGKDAGRAGGTASSGRKSQPGGRG
jgi:hypothetical protein